MCGGGVRCGVWGWLCVCVCEVCVCVCDLACLK